MSRSETKIKHVQQECNKFTDTYLRDAGRLITDGEKGHATNKRIMMCKYYLGGGEQRTGAITEEFRDRMRHPHSRTFSSKEMLKTGAERRAEQRRVNHPRNFRDLEGTATYDGKTVPEWTVQWLDKARHYKGGGRAWQGEVVSGVRTAAYSESLCYGICGAPACPGLCAGRSSNHNFERGGGYPDGALDLSDYIRFGEIMRELGGPLKNDLPNDRVHYSADGH